MDFKENLSGYGLEIKAMVGWPVDIDLEHHYQFLPKPKITN